MLYTAKKGLNPVFASPHIMSAAWLSQIPVSHVRSGNLGSTFEMPVPSGMAAVHATTLGSRAMRSAMASPNAAVNERPPFLSSTRQPSFSMSSSMLNGLGEWNVQLSFSAKAKPFPFTVFTWRTMGRSNSFASLRTSTSALMSWPSTGPTVTRLKCSNQPFSWTSCASDLETSPRRW